MKENTNIQQLLENVPRYEIQPLAVSAEEFSRTHAVYTGVPRRHSNDPERLVIISGLENGNGIFYEFYSKDVDRWKNVENMMTPDGTALPVVRIWVRHGAYALKSEPFIVQGSEAFQAFLEH